MYNRKKTPKHETKKTEKINQLIKKILQEEVF